MVLATVSPFVELTAREITTSDSAFIQSPPKFRMGGYRIFESPEIGESFVLNGYFVDRHDIESSSFSQT